MEQHFKIVAMLHIVLGAIGLLAAIAIFVFGAGAGLLSQDPDAALASGACGTIVAVIVGVLSLPSLIAGLGLQKRKSWARILTIILSAINLMNVPIGTAVGGYSLWALLNAEAPAYFNR